MSNKIKIIHKIKMKIKFKKIKTIKTIKTINKLKIPKKINPYKNKKKYRIL